MPFPQINTWIDWLLFGYNLVASKSTAVPKRGALNFLDPFVVTDNASNGTTDITVDGSQLGFELAPMDLDFHEVRNGTLPGFMPSNLIILNEQFTDPSLTRFAILSEGTPVTPTISGGQMTLSNTSGQNTGVQEGPSITVPNFAVSLNFVSSTSIIGNSYENHAVGVAKDSNNFILAVWRKREGTNGYISVQVKISGSSTFQGDIVLGSAYTTPFQLGLSLVANTLVVWQKPNGGSWTKITSYDVSGTFNFKTSSLTGWKPVFWLATDSVHPVTVVVSNFEYGPFGGTSIRDICPMTSLDGTPVLSGSLVTCTATLADPTGAAYCGIVTYDLASKVLTQTGVLFVNRGSALQNDGAAHLIQDGSGGYHLFITTWGNAGSGASNINILYKHETMLNLSAGVNIIASMTQLTLPGIPSGGGTYDPFATLDGALWRLAFTVGPSSSNQYFPSLASTPDLTTYTLIGQDAASILFEGTRITKLGGTYTLLASTVVTSAGLTGAAGVAYVRAYDMSMNWIGNIYPRGFIDTAANNYPPHCSLIPYGAYVYWLTFDNSEQNSVSGTQGQFRVFRALRYGPGID